MRILAVGSLVGLLSGCAVSGTSAPGSKTPASTEKNEGWSAQERDSFVSSCGEGIRRSLRKKEQSAEPETVKATCACTQKGAEARFSEASDLVASELEEVGAACGNEHLAKRIYGAWPTSFKEAFRAQCSGDGSDAKVAQLCECALGKLEQNFTLLDVEQRKMGAKDGQAAREACMADLGLRSVEVTPAEQEQAPTEGGSLPEAEVPAPDSMPPAE